MTTIRAMPSTVRCGSIERSSIAEGRLIKFPWADGRAVKRQAVSVASGLPLFHLTGHLSPRLIVWNGRPRVIKTRLTLVREPAVVAASQLFSGEFGDYR